MLPRNYFLNLGKLHNTIFISFNIVYQVISCSTDLVGKCFAIRLDICSIHHSPSSPRSNWPHHSPKVSTRSEGCAPWAEVWGSQQKRMVWTHKNMLTILRLVHDRCNWPPNSSTLHLYEYTHKASRVHYSHFTDEEIKTPRYEVTDSGSPVRKWHI